MCRTDYLNLQLESESESIYSARTKNGTYSKHNINKRSHKEAGQDQVTVFLSLPPNRVTLLRQLLKSYRQLK